MVDQEWGLRSGDPVDVYLSDGVRARLTVAAVVRTGIGGTAAFLTPPRTLKAPWSAGSMSDCAPGQTGRRPTPSSSGPPET